MTSVGISHRTHGERKMKRESVMECFISPFTRLMILFASLVEAEAADGERDEKVALPAFGFYWICRKNWTIRLMNCWFMRRCGGCWTRNTNAVELIKEARLLLIRNICTRCAMLTKAIQGRATKSGLFFLFSLSRTATSKGSVEKSAPSTVTHFHEPEKSEVSVLLNMFSGKLRHLISIALKVSWGLSCDANESEHTQECC